MEPSSQLKVVVQDTGKSFVISHGILEIPSKSWKLKLYNETYTHYHAVKATLDRLETRLRTDLLNLHKWCEEELQDLPTPKLLMAKKEIDLWRDKIVESTAELESPHPITLNKKNQRKNAIFVLDLHEGTSYKQLTPYAAAVHEEEEPSATNSSSKSFSDILEDLLDHLTRCLDLYQAKKFEDLRNAGQNLMELSGSILHCCLTYTHHFASLSTTLSDRTNLVQTAINKDALFYTEYLKASTCYNLKHRYQSWAEKHLLSDEYRTSEYSKAKKVKLS